MSVAHSSPDLIPARTATPRRTPAPIDAARRLSHTLNNLLAVISGHLEVFEMPRDLSDDDQRSMAAIRRAIDDAAGVARDVAALSVSAPPRPIRILLVEHDERRRHLFEVILRSRHFVVASFEDPPADPPPAGAVDLVVADRPCDCGVPAVYTGAAAASDRRADADGQQMWLAEPFAAADLLQAVTRLTRRAGIEA